MASGPHTFMTANVFTAERFQGNRLAIVSARGNALSQARKQLLAKEFGFSETVFLHDAPGPGLPRRLDIFTEKEEVPFAGHPVIGTAAYIFSYLEPQRYSGSNDRENRQSAVLLTKAGPITVLSNPYRQVYACVVPHNFHIHKHRTSFENVVGTQPQIEIVPGMERLKEKTFPVVSIVKGMTFSLIDLTDAPEVMAALRAGEAPAAKLDDEWDVGLVGCLYYQRRGMKEKEGEAAILEIHQRMITDGQEDPGTGSASCALGCYLALSMGLSKNDREGHELDEDKASQASAEITDRTKSMTISGKKEHHVFGIEQGVELGRKCQICVEVDITQDEEGQGSVGAVMLSGRCSFVTRGELLGTA